MIDLSHENLITFKEVTQHLPKRPNGRRLHVSCIYRWSSKGINGVKLETIRIGGTTYTSLEALQRFADARTQNNGSNTPRRTFTSRSRQAQAQAAACQVREELGLDEPSAVSPQPPHPAHAMHLPVQDETAQVTETKPVDASTACKRDGDQTAQPTVNKRFTA
jgi:hypothetical protein